MHIPDELKTARAEIDALDQNLIMLLAKRQAVVERVIKIKQQHNLPANIPQRVAEVIERAANNAAESGASPDLARSIWTVMVDWFVKFESQRLRS
jgi:isochorismate pyruvate lyase